jgi:hypothetical protein
MKHGKIVTGFSIFFLILSLFLVASLASASPVGILSTTKRGASDVTWSYPDGSYTIGTTTFNVGIRISGASDVWGWGFDSVTWNPSVVELVNAYEGSYLEDEENPDGPWTTLFVKGNIDNVNGVMVNGIGDAIQDGTDVHSSLASGELCYLKFKIVGVGDANIQFVNPSLCDGVSTVFTSITNPTVTVDGSPNMCTLTVTSQDNLGSPSPSGTPSYASDTSVTASVTSPSQNPYGVSYVCTGWTGTGSVPESGSGTEVFFTITEDSTITWHWQTAPDSSPSPSPSPSESPSPTPTPTETPTPTPTSSPSPTQTPAQSTIDVYTQRGGEGANVNSNAFGPQEQVTLIAKVTSGDSTLVSQQSVLFTIQGFGDPVTQSVITNTSGVAAFQYRLPTSASNPTILNVTSVANVSGVVITDSCAFRFGYLIQTLDATVASGDGTTPHVNRNSVVSIDVTVSNLNWSTSSRDQTTFYLAGTMYDNKSVPVLCQLTQKSINPTVSALCDPFDSYNATYTLTFTVPAGTATGPSVIYINAFTGDPTQYGVPCCPEIFVKLTIDV